LGDKTLREATKGSVAAMTDPEMEFTNLLNYLKEYLNRPTNYLADPLNYRENNPEKDSLYQTQIKIKIMESGIFYEGGLKGKILLQTHSGQVRNRKVWPISNLHDLLSELTSVMTFATEGEEEVRGYVSADFDDLLIAFDRVAPLARLGGIKKLTLEKRKQELEGWKEKTISKISISKKQIAPTIAEILITHLPPKTPDLTIAERIKELMAAFNQESRKIRTLTDMVAKIGINR
jgi:hypothetical protein